MQFVECANTFESEIAVFKGSLRVDGKSIMQMAMLAATQGTKLRITAQGNDALKAVETLATVIERKGV
jgi:phosphocarrier protein